MRDRRDPTVNSDLKEKAAIDWPHIEKYFPQIALVWPPQGKRNIRELNTEAE